MTALRQVRATAGVLAALTLVAACAGAPATPSPAATAAPIATALATTPAATPSPSVEAASTLAPVLPGEPWIVYVAQISEDGANGIRIVRTDGTGDHWLFPDVTLPNGGWQVHPDWSPDGTRLAFAADDPEVAPGAEFTRDLWVSDADGSNAERVLDCVDPCFVADDPAWSPDGRTLAFVTWGSTGVAAMALLDVATRTVNSVGADRNPSGFLWPRWSPDGRRIVLEHQTWTAGAEERIVDSTIGIVDLDAPTPAYTPITAPDMWATYPDWHPTEDLIVFSTRPWRELDDGPSNLFTITPDGKTVTGLTRFGPDQTRAVQPTWLPDGSGVIFTAVEPYGAADPTTMALIDADGSGLRPATASGRQFGTHARLRPTADR